MFSLPIFGPLWAAHPILSTLASAVLALAFAFVWVTHLRYRFSHRSVARLRGRASDSPITGNLASVAHLDAGVAISQHVRDYGKISVYRSILNVPMVVIADAKAINYVMSHSDDFPKNAMTRRFLTRVLGEGVLVVEGDLHRRQRKVMLPSFSQQSVRDLAPIFLEIAYEFKDKVLALAKEDEVVDIYHWFGRGTLDVIGKAGFAYDFDALKNDDNKLAQAFGAMFTSGSSFSIVPLLQSIYPVLRLIPTKTGKATARSMATMRSVSQDIVAKTKASIEAAAGGGSVGKESFDSRDLISQLIRANIAADLPANQRLTDEEVACQITTFMLAGYETSSTALTWISDILASHPEIQSKLRKEVLGVTDDMPSLDDLNALPYLDAVVREGLRLQAPVPETSRVSAKDVVLPLSEPFTDRDGKVHSTLRLDKGTSIIVPILEMNTSTEIWGEDAKTFNPDRWLSDLPDATKALDVPWANLLTFIAGSRSCIGYRFALAEIKAFLFVTLRHMSLAHPSPKPDYWHRTNLVQRPIVRGEEKKGYQLRLKVRPVKTAEEEDA